MASAEHPALRLVPRLEDRLRSIFNCEVVECPMVKTLDQQLDDLRALAHKIKAKFGIDLEDAEELVGQIRKGEITEEDGIELIRQLLEKFFRLDRYIDSLR